VVSKLLNAFKQLSVSFQAMGSHRNDPTFRSAL